ncbi:MAG: amidohydrolase [Bacillaceae bacterium]|nr:amidohydrolase [Bacillaceae bacterium]
MVEVRRHLHQYPELSHRETRTAKYIRESLEQWGIQTVSYTGKDVVGILKGAQEGETVALRADIDALPVEEKTGLHYASTNQGVMHACGHDGHTAILLCVARVLSKYRDLIKGTIRFIFQHAEEVVPGGAKELVEAGVMEDVDGIFGLHLWQPVEKGIVAAKKGPLMAGSDGFFITIHGKGGHGSMPHDTIDPVVVAAHLVSQLQSVVSRFVDPVYPAVLSVGKIMAGDSYNIIPDRAEIAGTVRYFDPKVRDQIEERIHRMAEGTCTSFGATCDINYVHGDPSVINDDKMNQIVMEVAEKVVGSDRVIEAVPSMGGEDFSYYLTQKPGAYFFLGMGGENARYPHHHPQFTIDESVMPIGVKMLTYSALQFLQLEVS